jgi:hypothetical protein
VKNVTCRQQHVIVGTRADVHCCCLCHHAWPTCPFRVPTAAGCTYDLHRPAHALSGSGFSPSYLHPPPLQNVTCRAYAAMPQLFPGDIEQQNYLRFLIQAAAIKAAAGAAAARGDPGLAHKCGECETRGGELPGPHSSHHNPSPRLPRGRLGRSQPTHVLYCTVLYCIPAAGAALQGHS